MVPMELKALEASWIFWEFKIPKEEEKGVEEWGFYFSIIAALLWFCLAFQGSPFKLFIEIAQVFNWSPARAQKP